MAHSNFGVKITIPAKAVENLVKENILKFPIGKYKDKEGFNFDKIIWITDNFCESGREDAIIYFKDGRTEEINDIDDIFTDDWGVFYLSQNSNCFYDYVDTSDIKELLKIEKNIITNNEIKNWFTGMTAKLFNCRIDRD